MANTSWVGIGNVQWRPYSAGAVGQYLSDSKPAGEVKDDVVDNKQVIKQLLRALEDAEKTSKTQTVQELRNTLNETRKELGEDAFKALIEELKQGLSESWLEILKRMFPDLFTDAPSPSPSPAPSPGGGGGGGGGGGRSRVNPSDFGPAESMSNKPITEGAKHFNYKPDNSNPGKKPDNIWSGFTQGPDSNCITVSAIKAAMMQYGQQPTDVYKSVKETANGYDVVMKDSNQVYTLSKDELRQAATHARFKGDDPKMMEAANFMYAMSAKRAQYENNDGTAGHGFMAAMQSLNNGEHAREGLDRLGLKGRYRPATDSDLRSSKVGTVEYGGHSMAVINGRVELWSRRGGIPKSGIATVLF